MEGERKKGGERGRMRRETSRDEGNNVGLGHQEAVNLSSTLFSEKQIVRWYY